MATNDNAKLDAALKALKEGLEQAKLKKDFKLKEFMMKRVTSPVMTKAEADEKLKAYGKPATVAPAKRVLILGGTVMAKCEAAAGKIWSEAVYSGHVGQMADRIADKIIGGLALEAAIVQVKAEKPPVGQVVKSRDAIGTDLKSIKQQLDILVGMKALGKAGQAKVNAALATIREEIAKASVKDAKEEPKEEKKEEKIAA